MTSQTMTFLSKATDNQLKTIAFHDNGIPTHLASGVALEMIERNIWRGVIIYAAKRAFRNAGYVITHKLKSDWEEIFQIAHITIMSKIEKFTPGMTTMRTYIIMCLEKKFMQLRIKAEAQMRKGNMDAKDVDGLEEKVRDSLFESPVNVERTVINKIMLEQGWECLRDMEKLAVTLDQQGYSQYEIAERIGVHKRYGNVLLKRAYGKMKAKMGA